MIAERITGDMRATARMLAEAAREAKPAMLKVLLFHAESEIRLIYIDATAHPAGEDEKTAPYYFRPSPNNGINFNSAVALVRPEEEGRLGLPPGWGTWGDAEILWEANAITMTSQAEVQYISDADGKEVGVIVPIDLWHEIESERETAYLLKSENMKRRLLEAKERQGGISLEDALERLGV